eukprot:5681072-Heterocapsa_arctica.AAC.1
MADIYAKLSKRHLRQTVQQDLVAGIHEESKRYAAVKKPWQDGDGEITWPFWRVLVGRLLMSQQFEGLMGLIIMAN